MEEIIHKEEKKYVFKDPNFDVSILNLKKYFIKLIFYFIIKNKINF